MHWSVSFGIRQETPSEVGKMFRLNTKMII
jgi:hypothetical protein